ncbi:unnamed protein product [Penicillium manginii]
MDRLYTHESHAYEAVKGLQGLEIPRYYGSYSISLPISPGSQQNREVRMILIEFINGPSMGDIWGTLVITSQLEDLAPRNVMLVGPVEQAGVVFVDFGDVLLKLCRANSVTEVESRYLGQYVSPLLRWVHSPPSEFFRMVGWDWQSWVEREFANTESTITPEMRKDWDNEGIEME